jgi:hypothetical protein
MSKSSKYPNLPLLVPGTALQPLPDYLLNPIMSQAPVMPQGPMIPSLAPPGLPVIHSLPPRPFSSPSEKSVYIYRGEGNNGELKVFSTFAKLKKFLMAHHGRIYQDRKLSREEFLEMSQGWGFEIQIADFY